MKKKLIQTPKIVSMNRPNIILDSAEPRGKCRMHLHPCAQHILAKNANKKITTISQKHAI